MAFFRLLRTALIGETPFAMTSVALQMAAYIRTTVAAVIVAHSGNAAGLSGAMLHGTIWNREKQATYFIELELSSDLVFWLDWQSCAQLPTSY